MNPNPIVPCDCPDPDVIRVGDTYYMICTTMHFFPGGEILRSFDLIHWEHAAYVFDRLDDTPAQRLRGGNIYGKGMWAASLRYHDGVFYVCFSANDTQRSYLFTARDIRGPWTKKVMEGFYHDASLLFDDDGAVWLAHGHGEIHITRLRPDCGGPMEGGLNRVVVRDTGNPYLGYEGAHLYKIHGKYCLFLIHSRRDRWRRVQACFTADSLDGEFVGGDILDDDRGFLDQGVAQGGAVDTPEGNWYAILFQDSGAVGRLPILLPMSWKDGAPVLGKQGRVPEEIPIRCTRPGADCKSLTESDDFRGPWKDCWQFNHQPDRSLICRDTARGIWRVRTDQVSADLTGALNTITQRMRVPACAAEVTVLGADLREGDVAGLCALQGCYGLIGLTRRQGSLWLIVLTRDEDGVERERCAIHMETDRVRVRLTADFTRMRDLASFGYLDGNRWRRVGPGHRLLFRLDHFTGCRFGLTVYSTLQPGGSGGFRGFRYDCE